jgi:hypothetical protein
MNGMILTSSRPSVRRLAFLCGVAFFVASATGCVHYTAHVTVGPEGEVHVRERAEMMAGVADSMRLDPKLVWTAFEAATQARGGRFTKDRPDSLHGATGEYDLDAWSELGQRGQAFKGIDEIERRTKPANVQYEVKDQYFFTITTLGYNLELTEPQGAAVDSVWAPWVQQASGEVTFEVPGEIIKTNAPKRAGNQLTYPLAYGQTLDVEVSYKQMQWVAVVSVVLVGIFLLYLLFAGLKAWGARKKKNSAPPQPAS